MSIDILRISSLSEPSLIAEAVRVFRDAREGDLHFLLKLHDAKEDLDYFRHVILVENEVWLAEMEGRAAGFVAFAPGWVNHLYVATVFQGRGVGTALLEQARKSNRMLQLWVFEANHRAIDFYRRRGFVAVERTDGAGNEAKMPDLRMRWDAPIS